MTKKEFKRLDVGDVVRSGLLGHTYVVTANYGDRVTAIRTADMTNPTEWDLVSKVERRA
jgi:hypothetical protein